MKKKERNVLMQIGNEYRDHRPLVHSENRSPSRKNPLLQSNRIILPLNNGVTNPFISFGGLQVRVRRARSALLDPLCRPRGRG